MAPFTCSWILALFVASVTSQTPPVSVDGVVTTKGTVTNDDGTVVHLTKIADVECNMEQVTATEADGSVSAVLKDYRKGKGVLLKSTVPFACYVLDIPEDEEQLQAEYCENGVTSIPARLRAKARAYEESGTVSATELSDDLAEQCKGRRLLRLKEVAVSSNGPTEVADRRRCSTTGRVCQREPVQCHDVCTKYGWWTASSMCHRSEMQCDYATRCYDAPRC